MGARARFCALARTLLSVPLMSGQMIGRLVPPIRDLAFPHVVKHKNQKSREKSHFSFNRSFFFSLQTSLHISQWKPLSTQRTISNVASILSVSRFCLTVINEIRSLSQKVLIHDSFYFIALPLRLLYFCQNVKSEGS